MTTNTKTKFVTHHKKLLLLTTLLITVLFTSLLIYTFTTTRKNEPSTPPIETPPPKVTVHIKSEMELYNAINNTTEPTIITFNTDITLIEPLTIHSHKDITLTSNNNAGNNKFYKLIGASNADTIIIESHGTLMLDGIIVTHNKDTLGRGVTIEPDGTLVMTNGEITGNTNQQSGGGVKNRGNFIMYDGKISDNIAVFGPNSEDEWPFSGGGVANSGTFTMYGGEITGNVAMNSIKDYNCYGGGVGNQCH